MKTERTQIRFLSDVLVAVASLDLKVPNGPFRTFSFPLCLKQISIRGFPFNSGPIGVVCLALLVVELCPVPINM